MIKPKCKIKERLSNITITELINRSKKKTQSVIGDIFGFLHARVLVLDAENEARIKDKWETSYKI